MKKISVIIPAYNRAWCIGRAIESVLTQDYENWELIIIDDGSDDNTEDVMKKYTNDKRVSYHRLIKNKGVNFARNKGFELCTGDYIMPFDSDDEIKEGAFRKIVQEFSRIKNRKIGVLLFNCENNSGKIVGRYPRKRTIIRYRNIIEGKKLSGEKKSVIRSEVIKKDGFRYDSQSGQNETLFWLRVAEKYDFMFIPESIRIYHTEHKDRLTGPEQLEKKAVHQHAIYEAFLKRFKNDYLKYNPRKLSQIYLEKAVNEMIAGQKRWCRESLREAVKHNRKKAALARCVHLISLLPRPVAVIITKKAHRFKKVLL